MNILCWEGYDDPLVLGPYLRAGGTGIHAEPHVSDFLAAQRVLGNAGSWDILNINSPFVRDILYPWGKICELDAVRFHAPIESASMPDSFRELHRWGLSPAGKTIGVCQRFGPFNLVINTAALSITTAEDQGFDLAADPTQSGRYGILAYDDFNVLHIAIASGLDPFGVQSADAIERFAITARRWFSGARLVTTDHRKLNRALAACRT